MSEAPRWNLEIAQSYTSVEGLRRAGLISPEESAKLSCLGDRYRVRVTPYYASLMNPADRDCPIRLQAIPGLGEEDPTLPQWATRWSQRIYDRPFPWHADAIGDFEKLAAPRLTHRYSNRAIMHLSSLCAVYCRFCFRKEHLNDPERTLYDGTLDAAFDELKSRQEVRELILTGGDPLALTNAAIERVLERAQVIEHLKVVRIHSRMAVTLPSRLDEGLGQILQKTRLSVKLVSHFNHIKEWTPQARKGLEIMRHAGVDLYNQTVLLAGVNDSTDRLAELFQSLYENGVTPIYLHHPDWTPGTFQFRLSVERGQVIMRALRGKVAGPALPHYVVDLPQGGGKASLMDASLRLVERFDDDLSIDGAVYEIEAPHTRASPSTDLTTSPKTLYLDLWPKLTSH